MSLRNRREKLCEQFFETNIFNEKLKDLLPQTILHDYELKSIPKYIIIYVELRFLRTHFYLKAL